MDSRPKETLGNLVDKFAKAAFESLRDSGSSSEVWGAFEHPARKFVAETLMGGGLGKRWTSDWSTADVSNSIASAIPPIEKLVAREKYPLTNEQWTPDEASEINRLCREKILAPIDIAAIRSLSDLGLLDTFLVVDGVSLKWIFSNSLTESQRQIKSNQWLLDCLEEDTAPLFLATYTLWKQLVAYNNQHEVTSALAGNLAYVAITYGFYHEAIITTDYMLNIATTKIETPDQLLSRLNWMITKGVASSCLGLGTVASSLFRDALTIASDKAESVYSEESNYPAYQRVFKCIELYQAREQLRSLARSIFRSSGSNNATPEFPKFANPNNQRFLEEYIRQLESSKTIGDAIIWPIDYDTAARCTLLFYGKDEDWRVNKARELHDRSVERFGALQFRAKTYQGPIEEREKRKVQFARYVNSYEEDCIRTTKILLEIASDRKDEARAAFDCYCKWAAPESRRHSRMVARRLSRLVEAMK